jgi:hypothetical protein
MELHNQLQKFEEDKARQKEINIEIGRKRQLASMRSNPSVEFQSPSSIPSTNVRDLVQCVPLHPESHPRKKNIQSYFSPSPTSTSASQPSQTHPILDNHWNRQYKDVSFEYIARWWCDADICEFSRSYQLSSWSVFDQAKTLSFLLS